MLTLVLDDQSWSPGASAPSRIVNEWRDDGRVFAAAGTDGRQCWIDWVGLGVFLFDPGSPVVRFHRSSDVSADRIRHFFACVVQPLILQAQGWTALHASAAAGAGGAIVFCGLSGSGKSTLAYALGRHPGFRQIADDAVVMRQTDRGNFALACLPFRSRLRQPAADFFLSHPEAPPTTTPATHLEPPRLRAVVVLEQSRDAGGHNPDVHPIAPASAFTLLLTHAHCFDEHDRVATERMLQSFLTMADTVPVIGLRYRPDFAAMPVLLRTVLEAIPTVSLPHL